MHFSVHARYGTAAYVYYDIRNYTYVYIRGFSDGLTVCLIGYVDKLEDRAYEISMTAWLCQYSSYILIHFDWITIKLNFI